jgi:hypothetical protein
MTPGSENIVSSPKLHKNQTLGIQTASMYGDLLKVPTVLIASQKTPDNV